jgi:hypothetical protein
MPAHAKTETNQLYDVEQVRREARQSLADELLDEALATHATDLADLLAKQKRGGES